MAFPGRVDVTIALKDEFSAGVVGVRNEMDRLKGAAKDVGGTLPQGFNKASVAARGTSTAVQQVTVDTKALTLSMVGLGTTMIGVATASSRLGQAENRLEKSKVAVRRINDQIASTQKNLNRLISEGKTNTEDYAVQLQRLETAYIDLETKQTDVKLNQDVLNDTYILFATTVANTAINSLFLLKSTFSGLSLAQIKTTITTKLFGGATMVAGTTSVPIFGKAMQGATITTHGLGAALKAAFPPLIAITAAFAAWEALVAPFIKDQTGMNLSLIDFATNAFKAEDAIDGVNAELEKYKTLAGEATGETDDYADALRELFGIVDNTSDNAMINFWNRVIISQDESLGKLKQLKDELKDPSIRQALNFSSAPQGGAIQGGGLVVPASGGTVSIGGGVMTSRSQYTQHTSQVVTQAIVETNDPKLDTAIAQSAIQGFKRGNVVTKMSDLTGLTIEDELLNNGINPAALQEISKNPHLRVDMTPRTSQTPTGGVTESLRQKTFYGFVPIDQIPQEDRNIPPTFQEIFGKTAEEDLGAKFFAGRANLSFRETIDMQISTFTPEQRRIWRSLGQAAQKSEAQFIFQAQVAAPILGLPLEAIFKYLGIIPKTKSAKIDTSIFEEVDGGLFSRSSAGLEGMFARVMNQIENFEELAESQINPRSGLPSLTSRQAGRFNDLIQQGHMLAAVESGFFGEAPQMALKRGELNIFEFMRRRNIVGSGGIPIKTRPHQTGIDFSQFIGLIETTRGLRRVSGEQFLDDQTRSMNLNFLRTGLGKGDLRTIGSPATQQFIQTLARNGADPTAILGSGLVSASEMQGGAIRFAGRNRIALQQRQAELSARDEFFKSEAFLREVNIANFFGTALPSTGARFTGYLGRTAADLAKRGKGDASATINRLLIASAFTRGEIGERLGTQGLFSPFGSTDPIFSEIPHQVQRRWDDLLEAVSRFTGQDPSNIFGTQYGRKFAQNIRQHTSARLGEMAIRIMERRPIFVEEVPEFVERVTPYDWGQIQKALGTLDTDVDTQFRKDNIDSRNEVLRIEARAYHIERQEAYAIA